MRRVQARGTVATLFSALFFLLFNSCDTESPTSASSTNTTTPTNTQTGTEDTLIVMQLAESLQGQGVGAVDGYVSIGDSLVGGVEIYATHSSLGEESNLSKQQVANAAGDSVGYYRLVLEPGTYKLYFLLDQTAASNYAKTRFLTVIEDSVVRCNVDLADRNPKVVATTYGRKVSLNWERVLVFGPSGADPLSQVEYSVYRSTDSATWHFVPETSPYMYSTTQSSFLDSVPTFGIYYYKISWFDYRDNAPLESRVVKVVVENKPPTVYSVSVKDSLTHLSIIGATQELGTDETVDSLAVSVFQATGSPTGFLHVRDIPLMSPLQPGYSTSRPWFRYADSACDTGEYYFRFAVYDSSTATWGDTTRVYSLRYTKQLPAPIVAVSDSVLYVRLRIQSPTSTYIAYDNPIVIYRGTTSSGVTPLDTIGATSSSSSVYYRDFAAPIGTLYYAAAFLHKDLSVGKLSTPQKVVHTGTPAPPAISAVVDSGKSVVIYCQPSTTSFPIAVYRISATDTVSVDTFACASVSSGYCRTMDTPSAPGTYTYVAAHLGTAGTIGEFSQPRSIVFTNKLHAPRVTISSTGLVVRLQLYPVSGGSGYIISRGLQDPDAGDTTWEITSMSSSSYTYVHDTLATKGFYYYTVAAVAYGMDTTRDTTVSVYHTAEIAAPPAPELTAYPGYVRLKVYHGSGSDADYLFVDRRSMSETEFQHVGTVPLSSSTTYYSDTLIEKGTYFYRVRYYLDNGYVSDAGPAATVFYPNTPQAPTISSVVQTAAGELSATVSWSSVANATSYNIYRSTSSSSSMSYQTKVGATDAPAVTFTDTTVPALSTRYYYRVTAVNDGSESEISYYHYVYMY